MSRPRPRPLTAPTMQIISTVLLRPQVRQTSVNGHAVAERSPPRSKPWRAAPCLSSGGRWLRQSADFGLTLKRFPALP